MLLPFYIVIIIVIIVVVTLQHVVGIGIMNSNYFCNFIFFIFPPTLHSKSSDWNGLGLSW